MQSKSNKKILIVSHSFHPQNSPRSFRTTELAKELVRQGHKVTVLTPKHQNHEQFGKEHNLVINDLGQPKWQNFELKGNKFSVLFKRVFNRLSNLFFEYPNIELLGMVKRALKNEIGYDALISIAVPYPIHWGVAAAWQKNKSKNPAKVWIADCGDPYCLQENDTFQPPFYFRWVEKWFMRKADFISVPTESSYLGYFEEFHSKIKVIPQGFKFQEYQFQDKPNKNKVPVFAYAGLFIQGRRDPSAFCEYLLKSGKDFEFHIYTKNSSLVDSFVKKAPDKFIVHSFMPRMDLLRNLHQEVDFVVNFENVGPRQTPSKLIDYVLIDKPILSVKSFELDYEVINQFLDGDYSGSLEIENPEKYNIEEVTEKFLALI